MDLLTAIRLRRDIRSYYKPDPIPDNVLAIHISTWFTLGIEHSFRNCSFNCIYSDLLNIP